MLAGLYTIPLEQPFLPALAAGLWQQAGNNPLVLAQALVLLPNRRSVRALQQAFLNTAVSDSGGATVLPRMLAFGDVADDQALSTFDSLLPDAALPPPVSPTERLLWLAQFVEKQDSQLNSVQTIALARDLGRLFDELALYKIPHDALASLVSSDTSAQHDLAQHWQYTLRFTHIITRLWPEYLANIGRSDPAWYRAAQLQALAAAWTAQPPAQPVIMAGLARAEPQLVQLAQAVLKNPAGAVVLPGFSRTLPDEVWANLDAVHPESLLAALVRQLGSQHGATRANVQPWPSVVRPHVDAARAAWVESAMLPAAYTANWASPQQPVFDALPNVSMLTAEDEAHEAAVVALAIRQALAENKKQTVSVVTADRLLARRVAALLQRWQIVADDSSGLPYNVAPLATFLQLLAAVASPAASAADLLALLRHPFLHGSIDDAALEKNVLRGQFPALGFFGLLQHLHQHQSAVAALLQAAIAPFARLLQQPQASAHELLVTHLQAAEALLPPERLWHGAAAEVASLAYGTILESLPASMQVPTSTYAAWLAQLTSTLSVRVPYGQHPRVTIHGLIEARLQQADVMILAGLNEGVWPALPQASPWLNRKMRARLGLPPADEIIAQQAHDFISAMAAPRVILTQSARRDGAPAVAARWWHRLWAVLPPASRKSVTARHAPLLEWAKQLNTAAHLPALPTAPAPCPPLATRPHKLSVSSVELLMRNPYGHYAKEILRLRALPPLASLPSAADFGNFAHKVLADFCRQNPGFANTPAASQALLALAETALQPLAHLPAVQTFWQQRFQHLAAWWLETTAALPPQRRLALVETTGQHTWENWFGGPFTLHARPDRLDITAAADGNTLHVLDYKTGQIPRASAVRQGEAPQLSLTAVLATRGAFPQLEKFQHISAEYWQFGSITERHKVQNIAFDVVQAEAGLQALITAFRQAQQAYHPTPLPARAPRHNDYDHLARTAEWSDGPENAEDAA